jgi:NADPH:quinone reductase-like Zn-dependent oxidoreductase
MSFAEAASIPTGGDNALHFLRLAAVAPGERVVVNGAGGNIGVMAVQIAKHLGAEVTAVDRGDKIEFMQKLGADHTIDYGVESLESRRGEFDLVLDFVARKSFFSYRRTLRRGGRYVIVGGDLGCIVSGGLLGPIVSLFSSQSYGLLVAKPNEADHEKIVDYIRAGTVRPMVDRTYPLSQAAEALGYLGASHARGKVVVTV